MINEKSEKEESEKKRREKKNLFIQINTQADRRTDRQKSFIDMRYNTEQYSNLDSIESNRIYLKQSRVE